MTTEVPFIDLGAARRDLDGELEAAVAKTVESDWYLLGEELERFEAEFAEYCGVRCCVGVASGLSALELTLRAAGIGPGDEVIVPAYTFVASWLAIHNTGATPVGVEVEAENYNLDPRALSAAYGPRTAAIMPVHLRGEVAPMTEARDFAGRHGLFVIEDAAQAHGARQDGRRAGGLGDAAAFSFYPTKNLGALGDGGAVTTDDDALAAKVRLLRNYGSRDHYEFETAGFNSRLAEVQAAALRVSLPHLDRRNAARRELAAKYTDAFAGVAAIDLPVSRSDNEPVWHLYAVGLDDRDRCREELARRGIGALVHYPLPPHLTRPFADPSRGAGSFPVAERLAERELSLPMHPYLTTDDCARVIDALLEIVDV
jgi:dTDP-3-amino-3,4,6-trideoxy-alpha-D-glucose transaminase